MSLITDFLELFKSDDNTNYDQEKMFNENWDKIDVKAKEQSEQIENLYLDIQTIIHSEEIVGSGSKIFDLTPYMEAGKTYAFRFRMDYHAITTRKSLVNIGTRESWFYNEAGAGNYGVGISGIRYCSFYDGEFRITSGYATTAYLYEVKAKSFI